jgi:hypothetical protein
MPPKESGSVGATGRFKSATGTYSQPFTQVDGDTAIAVIILIALLYCSPSFLEDRTTNALAKLDPKPVPQPPAPKTPDVPSRGAEPL